MSAAWESLTAGLDVLEDVVPDPELLTAGPEVRARPLTLYHPSFKRSSLAPPGRWPAFSVTGSRCALQCDHCRGAILASMLAVPTPEALWDAASREARAGAAGMLLSGGSDRRNEIDYRPFLPVITRLKSAFPGFTVAVHTGLVDAPAARDLAAAGVDVAMLDLIGAVETVREDYHLDRPVADFEASLAALAATSMRVVPHIVAGLHYGRLLGEEAALEMAVRHPIGALVVVVAMPHYAHPARPFAVPEAGEVGGFLRAARARFPDVPLQLGCARPAGAVKSLMDAYGVLAGVDGIAHPAEGIPEFARRLGRPVALSPACCAMPLGV